MRSANFGAIACAFALVACRERSAGLDLGSPKKDAGFLKDVGTTEDSGAARDASSSVIDASDPADQGGWEDATVDATVDAAVDAGSGDSGAVESVHLQLLSLSDWRGHVDPLPPAQGSTVGIGGAAVLATYFGRERAESPHTIFVSSGNAFGASVQLSTIFDERPAVEALNLLGLKVDTLGNHNFDRGITQLQRMIDLSSAELVASNLGNLSANLSGVAAPFHLESVGGVKVAFVGITNPDAVQLSLAGRMGTLSVNEPIAAAMAARNAAGATGAQVFVALVQLGVLGGPTPSGPLLDFARGVSGFHVIFGGHTDVELNQLVNGAVVLENRSRGRTYGRVRLTVNGSVVTVDSVDLVTPLGNVSPDATVTAMLDGYRAQRSAKLDEPIALATQAFTRVGNAERLGEVAIGDLIADAMRARYGVQIAFFNSSTIRSGLPSTYSPADTTLLRTAAPYGIGPPFDLVLGDVYAVHPFTNTVVTRTVTGQQVWALLEHGVSNMPSAAGRFPQVSGVRFEFDDRNPVGSRVTSVTLANGTAIANDTASYSLATTDFVNAGNEGYSMLADGLGSFREPDAVVLAEYLREVGDLTPLTDGRIERVGAPSTDAGTADAATPDLGPAVTDASTDASADASSAELDAGAPDGASADAAPMDGGVIAPQRPQLGGDLVITEIMKDPSAVSDTLGEWFEVHNPTPVTFELEGCYVYDLGTDNYLVASSVVIGPGEFKTFAKSPTPGFAPSHVYSGFNLANTSDEVMLACPTAQGDVDIDFVFYDETNFPDRAGASLSLDGASLDADLNDEGRVWCAAAATYNGTDKGTPGAPNPTCP